MPMGIVSDSDFELEKSRIDLGDSIPQPKSDELTESAEIIDVTRGRPKGAVEVPNGLRQLIGTESITDGRQSALELARQFGVSPSSVSAYTNGATSTASYNQTPNKSSIDGMKLRVTKRARARLLSALTHITPEKLEEAKVRDLAGIAKDMSAIIKNMEPQTNENNLGNGSPTFIFYSPQFRKEDSYDIVKANE